MSVIKKTHQDIFLLVGLSFLVGLFYIYPQLRYWLSTSHFIFIRMDEPFYLTRFVRLLQGNFPIGNPNTLEHAHSAMAIPYLPEWLLSFPSRALVPFFSIETVLTISLLAFRFFFPIALFLLLFKLIERLKMPRAFCLVVAFWIVSEPGIFFYKPFGGLIFGMDGLPFNRFVNPLFNLPVFVASLIVLWDCLSTKKRSDGLAVLCGILVGAQLNISVYYWTHFLLGLALFAILSRKSINLRSLVIVGLVIIAFSVPMFLRSHWVSKEIPFNLYTWRLGLNIRSNGWELLPHKTLWPLFLLCIPLFLKKTMEARFLASFIAAGMICYFSPLITGHDFQNFHWHYTLAPLVLLGAAITLFTWSKKIKLEAKYKKAIPVCLLILFSLNSIAGIGREYKDFFQSEDYTTWVAHDRVFWAAWKWLREHAEKNSVILTSPADIEYVPLRTGLRVWNSSHLAVEPVSNEEIFRRSEIQFFVLGYKHTTIESILTPPNMPIPSWVFGLPKREEEELLQRGLPTLNPLERDKLTQRVLKIIDTDRRSPENLLRAVRPFALNYVVVRKNADVPGVATFLDATVCYEDPTTTIYKVNGWKK